MESQECRQGNWVLVPTNNDIKIPAYPKRIKGITKFGEFDFTEPEYPKSHIVSAKDCAGITLTEEILLKAGFVDGEYGYVMLSEDRSKYLMILEFDRYGSKKVRELFYDETEGLLHDISREFSFLHELQNYVYLKIGTELPIKF